MMYIQYSIDSIILFLIRIDSIKPIVLNITVLLVRVFYVDILTCTVYFLIIDISRVYFINELCVNTIHLFPLSYFYILVNGQILLIETRVPRVVVLWVINTTAPGSDVVKWMHD